MSSKNYKFAVTTTLVLVIGCYLFTVGYVLTTMADIDLRTVEWSRSLVETLLSSHPKLLGVLSLPVVYFIALMLGLVLNKRHFPPAEVAKVLTAEESLEADIAANSEVQQASSVVVANPENIGSPIEETEPVGEDIPTASSSLLNAQASSQNVALIERLKNDLVIAEEQLQLAESVKSQFLANMSHELRTPMNGILGMTELLMGSGLDNRQNRFADSIRRSAEALLAVFNDLLDFSKMKSGGLYLEKSTFNLREVIEDICDLQATAAEMKELELICHIDKSMQEKVIGDSNRVRQLVSNLIGNAIKFTKEGEIVVRIKQTEHNATMGTYQIDVVDTGPGITPEGQARIFESFTQADISSAREHGGAGLGLFITYKLIRLMGGEISLRSRMQEGSHFCVTLPLEALADQESGGDLTWTLRGARVLVVDDNETNRTILFHQLKSWGINPETVSSGINALQALRDAQASGQPYEAAILDLHMPNIDGVQLARMITDDSTICDVKRMMLTSAALDMTEQELRSIGVTQYITKPARQSQLYSALSELIPNAYSRNAMDKNVPESIFAPLNFSVLLAEDNLINQEVAYNMLINFGCAVEQVSNGKAALDICEEVKFDIIMMDCAMPVLSGLDATRTLRSSNGLNADTPVVALTANVSEDDEANCLAVGMNDYICKPVTQDELYRRLQKWSPQLRVEKQRPVIPDNGVIDSSKVKITKPIDLDDTQKLEDSIGESVKNYNGDAGGVSGKSQSEQSVSSVEQELPAKAAFSAIDNAIKATSDTKVVSAFTEQAANSDSAAHQVDRPNKVINVSAIDNIRKLQRPGKVDLVDKVVSVYLDKSTELVEDIANGCVDSDCKQVMEAAHSLKSSSAYVGADELSELCRKIEHAANRNAKDEIADLRETLVALYNQTCAELEPFRANAA